MAISGMGSAPALDVTKALLEQLEPAEVINLGIAGALGPGFEIGRIYRITQAVDWPDGKERPWPLTPGRFRDLPPATLVTSTKPVFSTEERGKLNPVGDLVDMEGAAVARAVVLDPALEADLRQDPELAPIVEAE